MHTDVWTYRDRSQLGADVTRNFDLTSYGVESLDGSIGKIDEATYEIGSSYIVVDTGPWIFGKKVMLPAGVINKIDLDTETIFADLTKDEIKNAPEFDEDAYTAEPYRSRLGGYYSQGGAGWRDW